MKVDNEKVIRLKYFSEVLKGLVTLNCPEVLRKHNCNGGIGSIRKNPKNGNKP
jgi:hypothetical protein